MENPSENETEQLKKRCSPKEVRARMLETALKVTPEQICAYFRKEAALAQIYND